MTAITNRPVTEAPTMLSPARLRRTHSCVSPCAPTPPCAVRSAFSSRWPPTRCRGCPVSRPPPNGSAARRWSPTAWLLYTLAGVAHVRRVGIGVLAGNIAFAVLVAVVLVAGWLPLTKLGVVATITFTAVTLAFAYAQYLGVRRLA